MNTNILAMCLKSPTDAPNIVKSMKKEIVRADFDTLLSTATTHPSAKYVATVAKDTSWCQLWDLALNHGVSGSPSLQSLLKVLSQRIFKDSACSSCETSLHADSQ